MRVDKLVSKNQPHNWLGIVTNECKGYPIGMIDIEMDELVVDLGCNVGGFYKAWEHRFNNWMPVEASKWNCELYKENTGLEPIHNAIYNKSGETLKLQSYIVNEEDTESGSFGTSEFVSSDGHGWKGDYEEVETISFKDLLGDKAIGLLKIDTEGAEYDFLIGNDLTNIKWITGEFHNFLGKQKHDELFGHILKTHKEVYSDGNGIESHYIKLFKRK